MTSDGIHSFVEDHARQTPDAVAILAPGRTPLTYRQLNQQIGRIIETLRCAGISRNDRVAVVFDDGTATADALLGIAAGAICVPLNPSLSAGEFESDMKALRAKVLVAAYGSRSPAVATASSLGMRILPWHADTLSLDRNHPSATKSTDPIAAPDDTALLLFTSGSSARPKLVPLTHRNIAVSGQNIRAALELSSADRCLGVMPLFHIHGLSTLYASMIAGGSFIGMPAFSPTSFFAAMQEFRPTWYSASPTIHRVILDQINLYPGDVRACGLRFIRSASAPMPRQLILDVEKAFGVPFIEAYGMTEAAPQIASNRLPAHERRLGSVGTAAGPEIAIVDEAGNTMPRGATGEVIVRGANVTHGYADDSGENGTAFVNGWLRSGDLGHLDADGFLFITGRVKEIINRGGEKISPRRVEEALLEHPAIAQAAAFGVPHPVLGENVAVAVVLRKKPLDPEQIRAFAATKLAPFEVPQQILFVDEIPLGPTGKLNRNTLAKRLKRTESAPAQATPHSPAQSKIAGIFAEVLKIDPPGAHENFFELGGHSLAATQVITRLRQIFRIDLPANCLFETPTVAQLATRIGESMANAVAEGSARLEQARAEAAEPAEITRRRDAGPIPLSFAQQRLFFVNQVGAGSAYNMSASLWLTGTLDQQALARSLDLIVRRHETLRTTFHMQGDQPVQVIAPPQPIDLTITDLSASSDRTAEALRVATEEAGRPFDLARGPLFRANLIRLGPDEHVLLLTMHHIISDGWSIGVLYRELRPLYEAAQQGRALRLDDLPVQYADFALWQRECIQDGRLNDQIAYWKSQLKDVPPACGFPTDRARPQIQSYRGSIRHLAIDRELTTRLRTLSQRENVTLFMTFLAAFKTLLFRYNGQEDCVVGTPIASRSRRELEPLIGFFANTLVLRTDLSGDPTFGELLARVRDTALGAYAHQEVPLERLVDELHIHRDPSRTPLFQVMFAFQSLPEADIARSFDLAPNLAARPFRIDNGTAKFDLTLYLSESDDGMTATWQYNADLFDDATIERISRQFQTLLEGIAGDHTRPISQLRLLPDAERRQMEIDWNRTETRRVLSRSFIQLFAAQAVRTPDALAVMCDDVQLTYRELNLRVNQATRYLQKNGVAHGTLVGVCLHRSAELLPVLLGIWKAGGAFLSIDPEYPAERITFMLKDAGASLLVNEEKLRSWKPAIAQESIEDFEPTAPADALAYVIYTSGSTGKPKGVTITHGNVCHYAQAMAQTLGIAPSDRYLHTASFGFSSSIRQFTVPLACGAAVVIASSEQTRDPLALFEMIGQRKVSVIDIVPSFWNSCVQMLKSLEPAARSALLENRLRLILSASEPLPATLPKQWTRDLKHPAKIVNMYGQTETTGIVTVYPIPDESADSAPIAPIGRPISNTQAYVLNASRELVPIGGCGELYIGGAGVGNGYINQPELTARNFVPNPFSSHAENRLYRTGDMARYRPDGVIEIAGRADEQIKIRGFRIEPGEVEAAIREHPAVSECAVTAVNGEMTLEAGKRLVAFVAPNTDRLPDELRDFLRRKLPEYMVPQTIETLERLPRTGTGKIDRSALSARLASASAAAAAKPRAVRTAPRSTVEKALAEVWKKVLHIDNVGVDENFFDLGGNSLLSINVIVHAKQAGLELTLAQLYQHQTIAELAQVCEPNIAAAPPGRDEPSVLVTAESLRAYGREALVRAGLDARGAEIVTEVQLEASLRGQATHNMVSIPRYAKRIATGKLNPHPTIRIERETANSAAIDGDNGPGQWVSSVAMDVATRKAQQCGVGLVSVRRSNHFGAAGHYVWEATRAGLIGLCTTNGPLILAPTGGVTPTFGNNPLGVGIPASKHFPILLDIAMSVAPRGKIGLYVAEGKPLPPGWILDKQGRPSTDLADLAAGLGVPIGGHKGYGLALVMEVLAGALSGAGFCADHHREKLHRTPPAPPDYGHFFMAIDPNLFMPASEFTARVDRMIEQTRGGERADNVTEILIPGEMELRARKRSLAEGVRLRHSTWRALTSYAQDAGLHAELVVVK